MRKAARTLLRPLFIASLLTATSARTAAAEDRPTAASAPQAPDDGSGGVSTLTFVAPRQLGSSGSQSERGCTSLGTKCSANPLEGGGVFVSFGHMWKYVGFDVLGGATADMADRGYVDPSGASHSYGIERLSALAAVRVRGSVQSSWGRATLAAGPGFVYRLVAISGPVAGITSSLPTDASTYRSLALTADASVQLRTGRTTALALGVMLWMDRAGDVTTRRGPVAGEMHMVSGAQASVMPYLGFQFGP
jgi:hypothetical protein